MNKLSIIVLNYNGGEIVIKCLQSIKQAKVPDNWQRQILVVDNASMDFSLKEIRRKFPDILIIQNLENLGYAGGMNIGIKYALENNSEVVMILNQDTLLNRDCLTSLIKTLYSNQNIGVVGPVIEFKKNGLSIFDLGGEESTLYHFAIHVNNNKFDILKPVERKFLSGTCLLIKKETFKTVGLFDERFFLYYEDDDWCKRARNKGWHILIEPKAKIFHLLSSSIGQFSNRQIYYCTRNLLLYTQKNENYLILLLVIAYLNIRSIYYLFKGFNIGIIAFKGMIDFLRNEFGEVKI